MKRALLPVFVFLLFIPVSHADYKKLAEWRFAPVNSDNPIFFSDDKAFKGTIFKSSLKDEIQTIAVFEEEIPSSMSSVAALASWLNVRFFKNKARLDEVTSLNEKQNAFYLFVYEQKVDSESTQVPLLMRKKGSHVILFSSIFGGTDLLQEKKTLKSLIPLLDGL